MPAAKPVEVWWVDLGMAAKARPRLILALPPKPNELDIFTVVAHTTSCRGNSSVMRIKRSQGCNRAR
jgi:mRNA-degrading endonuclease toxin of MazEF toxin-antitoxin module